VLIHRSSSTGWASPVFPLGDVEHPARKRDHGLCVTRMIEKVLGQFGDADTVSRIVFPDPQIGPVLPCRTAAFDKRKRPSASCPDS
jgi:hypothetical protein